MFCRSASFSSNRYQIQFCAESSNPASFRLIPHVPGSIKSLRSSHNDILRSLRYTLKVNNNDMVRILALSAMESTAASFDTWTTKEDEEGFVRCPDIILSGFLNGLIYDKRGKDDSAPELALERRVNNNTVLKKLRIAFSLKTDDIQAIMSEQKYRVSVPEITAMMRSPDHKNYRECGDQFLRNFLRGLTQRVHNPKA